MRSLVPVVLAAMLGAVVASTFAEAGEPAATISPACSEYIPWGSEEKNRAGAVAAIREHLGAGRNHFLVLPIGGTSTICAW